jgi:hypothetical protein
VPFALKCQALCHCAMRAFPPVLIMCPWTGNLGWGASVVSRGLT